MPNTTKTTGGLADIRRSLLAVREKQREAASGAGDGIRRADRARPLPLSFTQQRLWFLDRWTPGQPVYNAPIALRLRCVLDREAFSRALGRLVTRHEVLRTSYPAENGVPTQVVAPAPDTIPLPVVDFSGLPRAEAEERAREFVGGEARRLFDLERGPMLRPALARLAAEEYVLVLGMHHIVTDGWSTGILVRELIELYQAETAGREPLLPPLPIQYADYSVWQRGRMTGEAVERQLAYWRERLADLPTVDFPADRPRPAVPTRAGATLETMLPQALADAANRLALEHKVTLLTVLLSAFTAVVARYTGQDDIVLGSVFSGRTRPEVEHLLGFFSNTLVLRTSTAGDPEFRELLARTHETVMGAHFNQELPFGHLVDELAPERDPSRNPLFQTSFTLQHSAVESAEVGDVRAEAFPLELGTARFDLAVQATEVPGEGLRLWAEYSTELFDAARIERLFGHFARVLEAATADPGVRLAALPLLTDAEYRQLTGEWSAAPAPSGSPETCLHELVESVVDTRPDAVAATFGGTSLTYRELDERADRLAAALRARGAGPETVVAVLAERGLELPVAFLGVHKSGASYVPLDPDHPPARLAAVLAEAGATLAVTTPDLAAALPETVEPLFVTEEALAPYPAVRQASGARAANLAYTIFTSGSTGRPKGVQVTHGAIVSFVRGIVDVFRLGLGDRVLQFANPAFDVSLFDFFAALGSGATVVQAPRRVLLDPSELTTLMRTEGVTVTDLPPAVLGRLDPAGLPELRALFVGLEAFPAELVNRWNTEGREFHNGYGPTEATVACIDHRCPHEHHEAMPPIGLPLPGYRAYVVDPAGNLVPVGVAGELLVGGAGLARAYTGQPALTAEKFGPDPFGTSERLYRTGDLVRRRADGALEFLGRADKQVKIRGLRIEPGEIEQALTALPEVGEAHVTAQGHGADARLVAYLTPAGAAAVEVDAVRRGLVARLPSYLVPAVFVVLPEFPRGASGKLDAARLPAPGEAAAPASAVAPRTPTEQTLARIWAEVLGESGFGVHDSFFSIGGNSMKVTQLVSRIQDEFGVTLELRDLFVNSTVAELAEVVEAAELAEVSDEELLALLAKADEGGAR
ncbi:amino acid adenylation domain-containing protein [Amycolatopsis sp. NPDC047767]|uniref:non-ribosomal peptide synthetase n=1 Tax=Amycolatopsis sp. NPDC047767 TaxID=3156765 RepID=UPI0034534A82